VPRAIEIRPLARDDDRTDFSCGEADLNRFLEHYAGQNQFKLHLAVTYVALVDDRIVGFATIAASSIERATVPIRRQRRRLPDCPLPVLRLARLGVDLRAQGSWIDLHVHLSTESGPGRYTEGFRLEAEHFAFRAVNYAQRTLMAGFTSVRDLGGEMSLALRDSINDGTTVGPHVYAAGKSIATTGGHADPTNGLNRRFADLVGTPGPAEGVINGPEQARQGGAPALPGRLGHDQDHRHRRCAELRALR
jgi:hypothetical protein